MRNVLTLTVWLLIVEIIFASSAYAYLDPGTGSIILQGLAAVLISMSIFWRKIYNAIRSFFSKKGKESS